MYNIDKYIEEKKKYFIKNNIKDELSIIKYIYIDLGKRINFDSTFLPYDENKSMERYIRYNSNSVEDLNEYFNKRIGTCKSLSYTLEYILSKFNINIMTVNDPLDKAKYKHVFNMVHLKDGRKFCMDLQQDLCNIKTNSFTSNFGLKSIYSPKLVISELEQKSIDRRIGYISNDKYYQDKYLRLLHKETDNIDNFLDKVDYILNNIESYSNDLDYITRQWYHKKVLEYFFNEEEFDYENNTGKIKIFDCFIENNGKKRFINFITVVDEDETVIYVYNKKESKYCRMGIDNWFTCLDNGLQVNNKLIRRNNKTMIK